MGERLMHYTSEPLAFDRTRTYAQAEPGAYGKPRGLWVSVEGEDDWPTWCRGKNFELDRLACAHEVALSGNARILRVKTVAGLDEFHGEFAVEGDLCRSLCLGPRDWGNDWRLVADRWDGIIIAPYQWSRRLDGPAGWYYGWDCASGCIWNLDAIASVEPVSAVHRG